MTRQTIRYSSDSGILIVPPFEVACLTELMGPQACIINGALLQFEAKGETVR